MFWLKYNKPHIEHRNMKIPKLHNEFIKTWSWYIIVKLISKKCWIELLKRKRYVSSKVYTGWVWPNWVNENCGIWWYYIGWNGSALRRTRKSSFFTQWWPVFSSFLREIFIVIQSNDGNTHLSIKFRRCQFTTGREDWERILQWIGLEKGECGHNVWVWVISWVLHYRSLCI